MTPFKAGLMFATVVAVVVFFVFGKSNPFEHPFILKAAFQNASNIGLNSPVRIAGVEVGRVSGLDRKPDSSAAVVTMKIRRDGLPIHRDAELKIRPRIFLEGNFFVDLSPGTPQAGNLHSGNTVPLAQTASPVQLDQVLTSLQADTRRDLQTLVQGYGDALYGKPLPGEDQAAGADRSTRGERASKSLNDSLRDAPDALRGVAIVNQALLGTQVHDLSRFIAGQAKISRALASREGSLKDLITNLNTTTGAFAAEQGSLRSTIHLLPGVLQQANPTFDALNRAFPPTRAFAREILPGVRETGPTIDAAFPWIEQTRALVSPAELQGLVADLKPTVANLAQLTNGTIQLLPQVDRVSKCLTRVILPTGDVKLNDPPLSTGLPNYKEFWQTLVSLSGESQNFDGNGQDTRFQPGGGDQTVSTGELPGLGRLFGNAAIKPIGSRPKRPARKPPYNRKFPCYKNKLPNLNSAQTGPGP